jgi:hypothetical protein
MFSFLRYYQFSKQLYQLSHHPVVYENFNWFIFWLKIELLACLIDFHSGRFGGYCLMISTCNFLLNVVFKHFHM